jgi:hypothetical protein
LPEAPTTAKDYRRSSLPLDHASKKLPTNHIGRVGNKRHQTSAGIDSIESQWQPENGMKPQEESRRL